MKGGLGGFVGRFTLVHVVTYLVAGLFFMNVMAYSDEFANNPAFAHFRPLDSPIVRAAVLFQLLRGALFAVILYPFKRVVVDSKYGWIMLWAVLFGLTSVGAVTATPGSIEGFIYTETSIRDHLIGYPEILSQTLLFSIIFYAWERRVRRKDKITSKYN